MAKPAKKNKIVSNLGLEELGNVGDLLNGPKAAGMTPIEIDIKLIDEDSNQPREIFDADTLQELAESIRDRGVKSPISVRPSEDEVGRYTINHGARRYRASIIARKKTIPAFVDTDYSKEDQIIENLHRDELTAREIANFIGRQMAAGKKQREIGKLIFKSEAYVSQHVTLLDLPEPVAEVFNEGRCADVTVINELVKAYKKAPEDVTAWLEDDSLELTRSSVKEFRDFLAEKDSKLHDEDDEETNSRTPKSKKASEADASKIKNAIVQVEYQGKVARILLNKRPPSKRSAWLRFEESGKEVKANLENVTLLALMEG